MKITTHKISAIILISFGLSVIFTIAEHTFYQFLDSDGVLHESMFLPLGAISFTVGVICLLTLLIKKIHCLLGKK